MKKLMNVFGFTLPEILVAVGIASGVSIVAMKSIQNSQEALKTADASSDIRYFDQKAKEVLTSSDACIQSFSGLNGSSATGITNIRDDGGVSVLAVGEKRGKTSVSSLSLSDSGLSNPVVASGTGYTNLVLVTDKGKGANGQFKTDTTLLKVTADGSGNIISCIAAKSAESGVWTNSTVDLNDIYYDSGNVGIGMSNPQFNLDLDGTLNFPNATNANGTAGILYKGGQPFLHDFNYGNNGTVTTEGFNTFLGIGVNGPLTVGSTSADATYTSRNTAIGFGAFDSGSSVYKNNMTVAGYDAGSSCYNGVTIGVDTPGNGCSSVNFGFNAGNGFHLQVAVGANSATQSTTSIAYNTAVGYNALNQADTQRNIAIGSNAAPLSTEFSSGLAYLGYNAGASALEGSNALGIGSNVLASAEYSGSYAVGSYAFNNLGASGSVQGMNTALGYRAGNNATDIVSTTLGGYQAGYSLTDSIDNNALGKEALYSTTTGNRNIAIGNEAMRANTTGYSNLAVGTRALYSSLTTHESTAIGANALRSNASGDMVAVGSSALRSNTTGVENTAVGKNALYANTSGNYNTAVGTDTMGAGAGADLIGYVAVGHQALQNAAAGGEYNVGIGYKSLQNAGAGNNNVGIGNQCLRDLGSGNGNVAIGAAMGNVTSGSTNVCMGVYCGVNITTGSNNTAIGGGSMGGNDSNYNDTIIENAITGSYNVGIGIDTFRGITSGGNNTAVGRSAGRYLSSGISNTAIGSYALYGVTGGATGVYNVSVGDSAHYRLTSGSNNTTVGRNSSTFLSTGYNNTVAGVSSAIDMTDGHSNVAVGYSAMANSTSAYQNVAVGRGALENLTTGNRNTAIGWGAGNLTISSSNATAMTRGIFIGTGARPGSASSDNEIVIGYDAYGKGSNTIQIGNSSITCFRVGNGTVYESSIGCPSDRRLKRDIQEIKFGDDFMNIFSELKLRTYIYRNQEKRDTGFIAQEVEELDPSLLGKPTEDGYLTVNYSKIRWMHFKASQQLAVDTEKLSEESELLKEGICEINPTAKICSL